MATAVTTDQAKVDAFLGKVIGDFSATLVSTMVTLGDRLGLFRDFDEHGPATSTELAARTGLNERYLCEWASALACAEYLDYDPASRRFALPPEHAVVLAQEHQPEFLGGAYQFFPPMFGVLDKVEEAFRRGGGVAMADYDPRIFEAMERMSAPTYDAMLVQKWVPAMPALQTLLEAGAEVADIGCGRGRALVNLARAFPQCRFVGYDSFRPNILRARANAEVAGVAERVRFEEHDVALGIPGAFDVVTSFDVIHDAVDPRGMLRAIRAAIKPGGRYMCVEPGISAKLEENKGPLGAMFYADGVMYCMTVSLAHGGEGLGTAGLPEPKLRELCIEAGFSTVSRVPIENPFNNVYEVIP